MVQRAFAVVCVREIYVCSISSGVGGGSASAKRVSGELVHVGYTIQGTEEGYAGGRSIQGIQEEYTGGGVYERA